MRLLRPVAVLATVLALVACGGDEGLDPEAEADLLEDAILTVDDLPDGFEETDADDDADDEAFDECAEDFDLDVDAVDDASVADEGPVAFTMEEAGRFAEIQAQLSSLDDTEAVEAFIDAFGDDDFVDCVAEGFIDEAEADGEEFLDVEIEGIDAVVDGDRSGGLRFSGEVSGFAFEASLQVVLVGHRLVSIESVFSEGATDDDVIEDAFDAMLERLDEGS